ncbi:hypothetical protein ACXYMP_15835 [Aliiroseovarius sp. CAU 1755]
MSALFFGICGLLQVHQPTAPAKSLLDFTNARISKTLPLHFHCAANGASWLDPDHLRIILAGNSEQQVCAGSCCLSDALHRAQGLSPRFRRVLTDRLLSVQQNNQTSSRSPAIECVG